MQRLLIPLFVCLILGAPSILFAQDAQNISVPPGPYLYPAHPNPHNQDFVCNFAGTYTFLQFIGHSNDTDLPQIFLCANDSFLLHHNGDAILTGDPQPGTTPGVAYAFYQCAPSIIGDNLQTVVTDPCVLNTPPSTNGLYITPGIANGGDSWFFNNGNNITTFGLGQPVSIFFAPITLDETTGTGSGYESTNVGAPPGPCVNVNTAAAFEVIYLNPITQQGVNTSFGDNCIGKFNIRGGYPEYDNTAVYNINIYLTGNPSVKAIIHTQQSQLFHNAPVIFSVPVSGNYTIEVEDGKSCPASFTMDMTACDPMGNVTLSFPDTLAPPATNHYCVPLTVENFDMISAQFSINWDPNILQFTGIEAINGVLDPALINNLNTNNTSLGQLGLVIYDTDPVGNVLSVPDGEALFNICFNVVGVLGQCTGLTITNSPTGVAFEDATGQSVPILQDTGRVCVQFLPMQLLIAITDTTCLGTASMEVTVTGGESPYDVIVREIPPGVTYSGNISGSGSTFTINGTIGNFNNLMESYSVCVTDNLDSLVCDTIDVLIPTLGAQIDFVQQPSCNGYGDGILDAIILVGGSPITDPSTYSFHWTTTNGTLVDPTQGYQDGTLNNDIHAGSYTLVITDNVRHCSTSASGSLGQPTPVSEDVITTTQASCSGVANGSITYTVEGGTPFAGNQYQFAWADANGNPVGAPGQNNPIVVNNVESGVYTVTVTDSKGCTDTNTVTVTDQRTVSINQGVVQNTSCFGLSDGGATVTITESSPSGNAYTFTWAPSGFTQFNTNLSSAYSNLPAGSYFVTGQDVAGCKDTITVVVKEPTKLVLSQNGLSNPGCGQPNSGSINVIAQGGTGGPNYTYTWDIPATGPNQNGLAVGDYNVTVTDVNGCKDSLSFTLVPPQPPAYAIDSIPVRCGSDGSLTANAPTAQTFKWESLPGNANLGNNAQISNLDGGTYAVTITDGMGCTAIDTVTLSGVIPLTFADTSITEPTCFGSKNGVLGITVQDGKPPYVQYKWNPNQTPSGATIFNLGAGVYSVTVTDNVGCTISGSFTLNQPPRVVNTISGVQGASCFGLCDGKAQVTTNYATTPPTSGAFTYVWSDGISTAANRTNLCPGMVIVTSSDANGCTDKDTINITQPAQVGATTNVTAASCFGIADGSASVTGNGGNGAPFTYQWSDPSNSSGSTVSNLPAGSYVVTITDSKGCTGIVGPVTITEPSEIVVTQDLINSHGPGCFGDNDGTLAVSVNGGNTGNFSFEWSDDMGVIGVTDTVILDSITSGFYSVVVTDAQGCTGSLEDMNLEDPAPVIGSYEDPAALICNGDVTTLHIDTITGGSGGPYQFSVDDGALLDIDFPVTLDGGIHLITYYDYLGCSFTDTLPILEPAPIEVTFSKPIIEIELGDSLTQLKPLITGAAVDHFVWTPGEFLHWPDSLNPYIHTVDSKTFTLVVYDEKGCSGTGSVQVDVDPNRNVYVPNVFIPGVGELNDHFNVYVGLGVELVNYMRVYDRWGELMYSKDRFMPNNDSAADGWDGKFNGKYVNPGVYIYIIEVKFLDGRVLLYRGDVTVVR